MDKSKLTICDVCDKKDVCSKCGKDLCSLDADGKCKYEPAYRITDTESICLGCYDKSNIKL